MTLVVDVPGRAAGRADLDPSPTSACWSRCARSRRDSSRPPQPYLVSVHGADRPGIVHRVAAIAAAGGNITDLTTRLAGGLYMLMAEVDLADDLDALDPRAHGDRWRARRRRHLRPADADLL